MSYHPTPTPTLYCADNDRVVVYASGDDSFLSGVYNITHKSSVGIKYTNADSSIKITYSSRVNNTKGGHWRWASNTSPFTLYYENPSTEACIPKTGWEDMDQNTFDGSIVDEQQPVYDVYQPCKVYDVYQKCESYDVYQKCVGQPTPTPTVTVTLPEPTPVATPVPTPVIQPIYVTIPDAPPGIMRNDLTEHVWVRAKPTITFSDRLNITKQYTPRKLKLRGLSLNYTDQVYVTGDQSLFSETLQLVDMFSHVPSLSADFPGFIGLPVDYIIRDQNNIDVFIPGLVSPGQLDIIILNRAGYSSLSPEYDTTQWTDYNLQNRLINVS